MMLKYWSIYCTDIFHTSQLSISWKLCGDICFKSIFLKPTVYVVRGRWWQCRERSQLQANDLFPWVTGPSLTSKCRGRRVGSCLSRWTLVKDAAMQTLQEKLPQPAISHRSLLVCDQLPSTPFLSFSLWRDETSSILKGKQLLSNPITALILWSSSFEPLPKKCMLHSCFTNDFPDVLWSYIHKNIKWVALLSYFPKGKIQYSHFNT